MWGTVSDEGELLEGKVWRDTVEGAWVKREQAEESRRAGWYIEV